MNIVEIVKNMIRFISEAVGGIFAPSHDHYPATGIQPFDGETYHSSGWAE